MDDMVLEAKDLADHNGESLRLGNLTLPRAIDITGERPRTYRLATRDGEPLYALPGRRRGTVSEIVALLKKRKLPHQQQTGDHHG